MANRLVVREMRYVTTPIVVTDIRPLVAESRHLKSAFVALSNVRSRYRASFSQVDWPLRPGYRTFG